MRGQCFCDKQQLSDDFCISKKTFDRYFKNDARMKSIERKKGPKLILWPRNQAWQYMTDILDELCE